MPRRTVDQWQKLFEAHHQSALSSATFCRQQGLCPKYFSLRKKQLGWLVKPDRQSSPPSPFIPTIRSSPPQVVELHWQDARLTLPSSVEPEWLATLLKALA